MTILVTGATGLIGSQLCSELLAQGHTIHYLTTRSEKIANEPNYKGFLWNLKQRTIDDACFQGVAVIINLVGATVAKPWTPKYKEAILFSRTASTILIASRLKEISHQVTRFISASGVSIYPNSVQERFDESSSAQGDGFLAKVVVAWEQAADTMKELGMTVTKVRTGVVLSGQEGALQKIVAPVKFYVGAPLGKGNQWMSWIHIDDICGVYKHVLDKNITGVVNAVAPQPVTNKELTKQVGAVLKRPIVLPNVPGFVLKAMLGERASLVLEGQYVLPDTLLKTGYVYAHPELKEALQDLLG